MKKAFLIVIVVTFIFNCSYLHAMFFDEFFKEVQAKNQTCEIDFLIDSNLTQQQQFEFGSISELDNEKELFTEIDFDVKNNSDCDIFIRVAILPIIIDENNPNTAYKLRNSSLEMVYLNDQENILNSELWDKSSDGYFYYKKSMKEGDSLENKLISGVKLKLNKEEMIELLDKKIQIGIRVESMQSEHEEYSTMWNGGKNE